MNTAKTLHSANKTYSKLRAMLPLTMLGAALLAGVPAQAQSRHPGGSPPSGSGGGGGGYSGGSRQSGSGPSSGGGSRQPGPSGGGYSGGSRPQTYSPGQSLPGYYRPGQSLPGNSGNRNSNPSSYNSGRGGYNTSGGYANPNTGGSGSGSPFNRNNSGYRRVPGVTGYGGNGLPGSSAADIVRNSSRSNRGGYGNGTGYSPTRDGGVLQSAPGQPFSRVSRSGEGYAYRYNNGLFGRSRYHYYGGWGDYYFGGGAGYFPYYYPGFTLGLTYLSPYSFYYGVFPPYIGAGAVFVTPPALSFVPYPIYSNGSYQNYSYDDSDNYYLSQQARRDGYDQGYREGYRASENQNRLDRALTDAISDIRNAWQRSDVQQLAKHTRRDSRIAVYLRGKYQYSLDVSDYLDITRDALRTTKTSRFELDTPRRQKADIYTVTGRHVYRDKDDIERTVHVSYVLEKMDAEWVITQVGTDPDSLNETNDNNETTAPGPSIEPSNNGDSYGVGE